MLKLQSLSNILKSVNIKLISRYYNDLLKKTFKIKKNLKLVT